MKLSALVCAQNDEAQLADCLRGLEFCDEIVVVADRCTDRTQDIARQFGARVIDGIFPLENYRKAAGVASCLGEWILEVEPDERVDAKLAYEIRAAIHGRPAGDWFDVPVHNYLGSTLVRRGWGGGFGATLSPKLFRRHVKHWSAARIAAPTTMRGRRAGGLETPLIRQAEADIGQWIARLDRQSWLRAQDLAEVGAPHSLPRAVLHGLRQFAACYLWRHGVREGAAGFLIALMAGLEPVLAALRTREILGARRAAAAVPSAANTQPARLGRTG